MKFLILQHEDASPAGATLEWLKLRELSFEIVRVDREPLPALESYEALIVLGGDVNVDQEEKFPWLKSEKAFIRDWIEQKKPLLGICLGGQLIAELLGAPVYRNTFWEIGWCDILIAEGSNLPGAGSVIPGFQWHGYVFETPPGAEAVFSGKYWKHQGYRYQDHVMGVQFHPEALKGFVMDCAEEQKDKASTDTTSSYEDIVAELGNISVASEWYHRLLDAHFLKTQKRA